MPRPRKGARLWLRPERKDDRGKVVAKSTWLILDGGEQVATGCAPSEIKAAETKLADYIASKHRPVRRAKDIEDIDVADVLSIYVDDCIPADMEEAERKKADARIERLAMFFGGLKLSQVNGTKCREYVVSRGKSGGARRDLEDLRAAINHHQEEGYHRGVVKVVLPSKGEPRTRWLTRDEAAKLLWICWRTREVQKGNHKGLPGPVVVTKKYPLRHLARFILIGLYTGTRAGAIASAAMEAGKGKSFVDLEHGMYYRLAGGKRETNKRQPPAPIPARLLAHMRRWAEVGKKTGATHFVEFNGKPVASVKTAFKSAVEKAGLTGRVTPHTLRHTAVTWLLRNRVPIWETAGYVGMSAKMVEDVYGHHHPDYLRQAANAIGSKPTARVESAETLVVSLAEERKKRAAAS